VAIFWREFPSRLANGWGGHREANLRSVRTLDWREEPGICLVKPHRMRVPWHVGPSPMLSIVTRDGFGFFDTLYLNRLNINCPPFRY